jgi:hypothetical protein
MKYILILFSIGFTNVALAEDYIGITLGQSSIDLEGYHEGFFYKAYGGIRSKYYGFEGAYMRLARFDITGQNTGSIGTSGIEGSGILFLPLSSNLEFLIKAGIFSWSASGDYNGGLIPQNKGTDITYGIAAQYTITENFSLRIEYQQFKNVLNGEVTTPSFGIKYKL